MATASAGGSSNDDVEKLKRKLRKRVTQAVDAVCGEWSRTQQQKPTSLQQSDVSMDRSYGSCRQLVTYISENMATSPGFIEQMDRIILACFSGASKRVLSSVATQEVWFRASDEEEDVEVEVGESREATTGRISRRGPRGHAKPIQRAADSDEVVIKQERAERESATPGTTASGRAVADDAGLERREVAGSLLTKRPRSRTSKKKLSTKKPLQELVLEPKKAPRRRPEVSSAEESVEADTDTDEEQKELNRPKKKMVSQQHEDVVVSAIPVEDEQGLLTFKEAIGELCYQDRRTPEQTAFFKERLRKSIQFVDALLCHPPPGKMCTRTCNKIRGSMCKSTAPCKDKMCRIWHDVEAHTDRCKNSKCEFKLRILVRETMYKLHDKQLEIKNASQKLRRKNSSLDELNTTELSEPGTFADAIATLESEIEKLEQELITEEAEMAEINGTLERYWATLNEIGIETRHDDIDNFPEFVAHYANKKKRK
ncbi:uncharacterized protein PITG_03506 [Phytophthora infestans T30-4]|uniref:Uncharacterized protein n=1 Tax=Phytophthora infestans (strain T30-4) TaxID=403677 RepID=D0MXS7_PHYIT|nr:uncharacterized protein PITG_03506 [Phytophthora infestans T30-4]EEY65975.1 conserved hypothetical protein [Phytophthora infestans T30-4]KAI9995825.1 hypothetical protein PInf_012893 [Phytophthora infestans]|eukprot:XP_002906574.1 conserved hypothetical protein [Phytophthora infestans T30-4]